MEIGIFSTRGIPPRHGAFETTAWELASYLARKGHHVLVQSMTGIQPTADERVPQGVEALPFTRGNSFRGDLRYDHTAYKALAPKVDVAVIFGYSSSFLWGPLKARSVPIVLNPDGMEWKRPKFPWHLRMGLRLLQSRGVRSANAVVADSPAIKEYLDETYGIDCHFAAYGADEFEVTPVDMPFRDRVGPEDYILVLGRLEPSCLTEYIVREYVESGRREKLLVVGPGAPKYRRALERIADDRVVFTGGLYGDRRGLFALRRYCRAYIDGHHTGGINPSTIEAMLAGRHIVAHDNPHIRAALGDCEATLYDYRPGDLAARLNALPEKRLGFQDPAYQNRARTVFSWDSICRVYERAIAQAMEGRAR